MENINEIIQDMAFQLGVECEEDNANWQIIKWYLEMAYDEGLANSLVKERNGG